MAIIDTDILCHEAESLLFFKGKLHILQDNWSKSFLHEKHFIFLNIFVTQYPCKCDKKTWMFVTSLFITQTQILQITNYGTHLWTGFTKYWSDKVLVHATKKISKSIYASDLSHHAACIHGK